MRISLLHGIVETYPAANQMDERVEYAEYPKHTEMLNTMCAIAALRAWVLAVSAATLEVTVVPIFSTITSAIP